MRTRFADFAAGVAEGLRPFRAAVRPLSYGLGMLAFGVLALVSFDLAGFPTFGKYWLLLGAMGGGGFLIYAWVTIFRASGLFERQSDSESSNDLDSRS